MLKCSQIYCLLFLSLVVVVIVVVVVVEVYAVDASDISTHAAKIVAHNNLSDQIEVIQCRGEDLKLPQQVDLVVSEWMGTLLLVRYWNPCVFCYTLCAVRNDVGIGSNCPR